MHTIIDKNSKHVPILEKTTSLAETRGGTPGLSQVTHTVNTQCRDTALQDPIGEALVVVVLDGSPIVDAFFNEADDFFDICFFGEVNAEPVAHGRHDCVDRDIVEASESRTAFTNGSDELTNLVAVFPRPNEALNNESSECLKS